MQCQLLEAQIRLAFQLVELVLPTELTAPILSCFRRSSAVASVGSWSLRRATSVSEGSLPFIASPATGSRLRLSSFRLAHTDAASRCSCHVRSVGASELHDGGGQRPATSERTEFPQDLSQPDHDRGLRHLRRTQRGW